MPVRAIPAFVWTAAPDGAMTFVDRDWYRWCGLTPEQTTGDWPRHVLHPKDRDRWVAEWRQAVGKGAEIDIEARMRREDGVYRGTFTRAVAQRGAGGEITAWHGCTVENHDRNEAEALTAERGREAEAVRRDARDRENVQVELNTALRESAEVRDRALGERETDVSVARDVNQQLLISGLRERERADQADVARERATLLAEAGRRLAETFDAEAALRQVTALAVPAMADLCFVDLMVANGELQRVAWAYAGDAQRVRIDEIQRYAPPRDRTNHQVAHAVVEREPVLVPDVSDAWLRSTAISPEHLAFMQALELRSVMTVPLVHQERPVGAMTFCFTAVSERRYEATDLTLAQELAVRAALAVENGRLYRELQLALRVRDDFLASTAHDLRTPLAAVKGYAQLLRRQLARPVRSAATAAGDVQSKGAGSPALMAGLTQIETAADRMARLLESLQDAARLQAGEAVEVYKRPTDLVTLARRMVSESGWHDARHPVRVEADMPVLIGEWDSDRLERALDNLINNALKYSPGGGDVVVSITREGSEAVLRVRDHGIGIPAADLPHIFERFHRGANVVGRVAGSGIGLADVHHVVTEHGGTVSVESEESEVGSQGGGTTVTVRLPLSGTEA